ncbi:hypothetical protein RI367_002792 [Sorochytrium milnesiophthora]
MDPAGSNSTEARLAEAYENEQNALTSSTVTAAMLVHLEDTVAKVAEELAITQAETRRAQQQQQQQQQQQVHCYASSQMSLEITDLVVKLKTQCSDSSAPAATLTTVPQ